MTVVFKSNYDSVIKALNLSTDEFLIGAGGELLSNVKINSRVDTGQTRDSWLYECQNENCVAVGSTSENAIWEEFGTGIYAEDENGRKSNKGRKTPWIYTDRHGKKVFTRGKTANHTLTRAMDSTEATLKMLAEDKYRRNMK